jgi:hypothetical protein
VYGARGSIELQYNTDDALYPTPLTPALSRGEREYDMRGEGVTAFGPLSFSRRGLG